MKQQDATHSEPIPIYCAHTDVWELAKFRPNPGNPNNHPPQQIELLAHIIRKTGWRNPIVVSDRSGLIVKGHARYAAARKLRTPQAPVDVQHYESAEQEHADLIADNRIAELAELDQKALTEMLAALHAQAGFDLSLTGYTPEEVAALLHSTPEAVEKALRVERTKIDWKRFKIFHCGVGDQIYCLPSLNYLVSYGTMEGKPPKREKPTTATTFIDSGMLTLARKIGSAAINKQEEVVAYAELCRGDWVAMMDIPMVPEVLKFLKLSPARAYKHHLANARKFAEIQTHVRKVFVIQGQTLGDYERCCDDMKPLITDRDVLAVGSIKNRADNAQLVSAIVATVHRFFPPNDMHLFGITNPATIKMALSYGATSGDSSTAGNAVARGEVLFVSKRENGYQLRKQTFAEMIGEPNISVNDRLWLTLTGWNMGQVEAAIGMNMVMEEAGVFLEAGLVQRETEPEPVIPVEPDKNIEG